MSTPMAVPDAVEGRVLLARADVLYCLGRAFLPPPKGWSIRDWGQPLVEDLNELALTLELDITPVRQAMAAECARWAAAAQCAQGQADTWLVEYARLFLTPPVPVTLNTGVYLEGCLGGHSTQMVRACYEAAGLEPDTVLRDLPDHVAMELEFVAGLWERAAQGNEEAAAMAEAFCAEFVHGWALPLEQACQAAAARLPAAAVYAALVRVLRQAVADPSLDAR